MKGTDKQIKWAEDIKAHAINNCKAQIEANNKIGMFSDENELYEIMILAIESIFAKVNDASVIINKREMFDSRTIDNNIRQALTLIRNGKMTVEQFAKSNGVKR